MSIFDDRIWIKVFGLDQGTSSGTLDDIEKRIKEAVSSEVGLSYISELPHFFTFYFPFDLKNNLEGEILVEIDGNWELRDYCGHLRYHNTVRRVLKETGLIIKSIWVDRPVRCRSRILTWSGRKEEEEWCSETTGLTLLIAHLRKGTLLRIGGRFKTYEFDKINEGRVFVLSLEEDYKNDRSYQRSSNPITIQGFVGNKHVFIPDCFIMKKKGIKICG